MSSASLGLVRSSTRLPRDPKQFTVRRASRFSSAPYSSSMAGNPSVPVPKQALVNICDPCVFAEILLSAFRHRFNPGAVSQDRERGIFVIGNPQQQRILIVRPFIRFCVRNCGASLAAVATALRTRCAPNTHVQEADCVIAWWTNGEVRCGGAPCVADVHLGADSTIEVPSPIVAGQPLVVYTGVLQIEWKSDAQEGRRVVFTIPQQRFNDEHFVTADDQAVRAYVSDATPNLATIATVLTGRVIVQAAFAQPLPGEWAYRVEVFVYGVAPQGDASPAEAMAPLTFEAVSACGERSVVTTMHVPLSAPFA